MNYQDRLIQHARPDFVSLMPNFSNLYSLLPQISLSFWNMGKSQTEI